LQIKFLYFSNDDCLDYRSVLKQAVKSKYHFSRLEA